MTRTLAVTVFALLALAATTAATLPPHATATKDWYSVTRESGSFHVVAGQAPGALASGYFLPLMNTTGWSNLVIRTTKGVADADQMYAAGLLEAYLTHENMYMNFVNVYGSGLNAKIEAWVEANMAYTNAQVGAERNASAYWNHVGLVMTQFDGLYDGYVAYGAHPLSKVDVWALSANGDIETLDPILGGAPPTTAFGSHCSGLVKVTDDLSELYIGHSTWNTFNSMLRIFKTYDFPLAAADTAATLVSFPSYGGALNSIDDFYTMSSQLAVSETTNGCMNSTLWKYVTPTSGVTTWIRTLVANRMADSGAMWVDVFSTAAAPVYLNQWFVVSYNLFTPGKSLAPGLLWVLEQRPGKIYSEDVTEYLELGYWPSYNVPFFKENYDICGFNQYEAEFGPYLFSYDKAARSMIFRRNQTDVTDIDSFAALMRYNNWKHDPASIGPDGKPNSGLAISSRFDLVTEAYPTNKWLQRAAFGATDTKATSYALMSAGNALTYAQSGPTHDQQPPFSWADWPSVTHLGMPQVYDFDFYTMDYYVSDNAE